jgi:hypothetical protein
LWPRQERRLKREERIESVKGAKKKTKITEIVGSVQEAKNKTKLKGTQA